MTGLKVDMAVFFMTEKVIAYLPIIRHFFMYVGLTLLSFNAFFLTFIFFQGTA